VQQINVGGALYEQRFTRCGRGRCWCERDGRHPKNGQPGHGPYWYRLYSTPRGTRARYIGKVLKLDGEPHDTSTSPRRRRHTKGATS
jgi:hypothetical protein